MFRRVLLFRNLTDNIPKNIGLYSVGVMLLLLFRIGIEPLRILLGLLAFLVSYSSIYVLNDLYDLEDDKSDERKVLRKPLAQGVVKKNEAVKIFISFLIVGILLSTLLNLLFICVVGSLVFVNLFYSIPLAGIRNQSLGVTYPRSLKHTLFGPVLVLLMQLLKIFLPWTISTDVIQFPVLFAVGFSLLYIILFKGYKEYCTIGDSVKQAPLLLAAIVVAFLLSMIVHSEPIGQGAIVLYVFAGIALFRNSHLTDRKVLLLSPVYIFLGIVALLYLMAIVLI